MVAAQFLIIDARDFDVDVHVVQHRAGDALLAFGHGRMIADAMFSGITIIRARAGNYTIEPFFLVLSKMAILL
jgi:hypothetical protein